MHFLRFSFVTRDGHSVRKSGLNKGCRAGSPFSVEVRLDPVGQVRTELEPDLLGQGGELGDSLSL